MDNYKVFQGKEVQTLGNVEQMTYFCYYGCITNFSKSTKVLLQTRQAFLDLNT